MAKLAGNFVAAPLNAAVNTTQELHQKSKAFKDMLDIVGPRGHDFKPNSSILKSVGGDHVTKYYILLHSSICFHSVCNQWKCIY